MDDVEVCAKSGAEACGEAVDAYAAADDRSSQVDVRYLLHLRRRGDGWSERGESGSGRGWRRWLFVATNWLRLRGFWPYASCTAERQHGSFDGGSSKTGPVDQQIEIG